MLCKGTEERWSVRGILGLVEATDPAQCLAGASQEACDFDFRAELGPQGTAAGGCAPTTLPTAEWQIVEGRSEHDLLVAIMFFNTYLGLGAVLGPGREGETIPDPSLMPPTWLSIVTLRFANKIGPQVSF